METTKKVLIFQGGWDGHEPALVAKRFGAMMEKHGYSCEISDSQEVLADREKLMAMDLTVKTSALRWRQDAALGAATVACAMPSVRTWSGNL